MFTLFGRPYLDRCSGNYYNVVTLNMPPSGPLSQFVQKIQFPPNSQFKSANQSQGDYCGLVLSNRFLPLTSNNYNRINLVLVDDVPALFSYLVSQNYTIDTSLTKMTIMTGLKFHTQNADSMIAFVKYNSK